MEVIVFLASIISRIICFTRLSSSGMHNVRPTKNKSPWSMDPYKIHCNALCCPERKPIFGFSSLLFRPFFSVLVLLAKV